MPEFLVCLSDARHDSYDIERRSLEAIHAELRICDCSAARDIVEQCADADGILLDLAPMDAQAISALKKCKVINRYGVGCDNVDIHAATARGIQITNVPDYCMEDVSDHALSLMLACLRHVALRDRSIRSGNWNIHRPSFRLSGKTLGIIGFGRIARALVRKSAGFGWKQVLAYDPYVSHDICHQFHVEKVGLEHLLRHSDIVSLHMPALPETCGMVNEEALSWMKPTAILINTSRGALVDDAALISALKGNKILAAGLDTHNVEPIPASSGYLTLDNVILTDHTAYNTVEAITELKTKSVQNIIDVLTGKSPKYKVISLKSYD